MTGRIKLVKIVYVADTKIIHEATQAQIAQLVEQRTENPRVTGSIPVLGIPGKASAAQVTTACYLRV